MLVARRARARGLPAARRRRRLAGRHRRRWPTRWRASIPGRVEVMHRTGPRGLGRSYVDGLQRALATDAELDLPDGRGPVARPRVSAGARRRGRRLRPRDRLALSERRQRRELAAAPHLPQRLREPVHPRRHRPLGDDCTSGFRCWRREALARLPLDRVVSDGYAFLVEMLFEAPPRLPHRRGADHLRRAPAGTAKVSGGVLLESLIMPWRLHVPRPRDAAERRTWHRSS